jgi:hypothetical protein
VKEPIMTRALLPSTILALFMVACVAENGDALSGGRGSGGGADDVAGGGAGGGDGTDPGGGTTPGEEPTDTGLCKEGIAHIGFAGQNFVADRKPGEIGKDRRRMKPFTALAGEFQRALGVVPAGLAASTAAYGDVPARWYAEPTAGAVSLYTTYTLAFGSCYDTMTAATFSQAPTAESAPIECAKMQRTIWQRTPSKDEITACADLALDLTTETNARRRWAHACASIMSSAGFTTY